MAHDHVEALRKLAHRYPEVEEGDSCVKRGFKARKKSFLFLGTRDDGYDVMVKLKDSVEEAEELSQKEPDRYTVGKHGWVTMKFSKDSPAPSGLLERWLDESYRVNVPKKLVAMLPESGPPG